MFSINQPIYIVDVGGNAVRECLITEVLKTRFHYENGAVKYTCMNNQVDKGLIWLNRDDAEIRLHEMTVAKEHATILQFDPGSFRNIKAPTFPIQPQLLTRTPTESEISSYTQKLRTYNDMVANHELLLTQYKKAMDDWFIRFRHYLYAKYLGGSNEKMRSLDSIIYQNAYARYIVNTRYEGDEPESDDFVDYVKVANEYAIAVGFAFDIVRKLNEIQELVD